MSVISLLVRNASDVFQVLAYSSTTIKSVRKEEIIRQWEKDPKVNEKKYYLMKYLESNCYICVRKTFIINRIYSRKQPLPNTTNKQTNKQVVYLGGSVD